MPADLFYSRSDADERWHRLAKYLAHSGMDRDAELLDRLANRAEKARRERYRAEARAGRRYGSERYVTLPRWVKPLLPARRAAGRKFPRLSKPAFSVAIRRIADLRIILRKS